MVRNIRLDHLSVCRSVCRSAKVSCGETGDWIRMPFGMMSGVGRGMGVLDFGGDRRKEGAVLAVNLGRPIVTNGDFVASLCGSTAIELSFGMVRAVGPGIDVLDGVHVPQGEGAVLGDFSAFASPLV